MILSLRSATTLRSGVRFGPANRSSHIGLLQILGNFRAMTGVRVLCGREIQSVNELQDAKLCVRDSKGFEASAELVLVGVGVRPASELAESAGIKIGEQRAIRVNRSMETSVPDIYAAGDCVETWHRLLNRTTYMPLGTTSHKQVGSPVRTP